MSESPAARVPELDLLRFVAAVSVMCYHRARTDLTMFGFLGVHLFFMISGFVILWTAMNKGPWQFVASRISRLYPSFWICMLLTVVLLTLSGTLVPLNELAANFSMIPSVFHQPMVDGVYWTLLIELKFYVLVYFVLLSGQMRHAERLLGGWLIICIVGVIPAAPYVLRYLALNGYAAFFIAGCYLYLLRTGQASKLCRAALGLSLVIAIAESVRAQGGFTHRHESWVDLCVAGVVALEFIVFYMVAARVWRLPSLKLWYLLGGMTYPLYLLHDQAGNVLTRWLDGIDRRWNVIIVIALIVGMSYMLAITVERRLCPAFYRWMTSRTRPQRPVPATV